MWQGEPVQAGAHICGHRGRNDVYPFPLDTVGHAIWPAAFFAKPAARDSFDYRAGTKRSIFRVTRPIERSRHGMCAKTKAPLLTTLFVSVVVLAGCVASDLERAAIGGAAGGVGAAALDGNIGTGIIIGAAGGALCDDIGICR
jgi:osmotically inducible lipoprotein OsmB